MKANGSWCWFCGQRLMGLNGNVCLRCSVAENTEWYRHNLRTGFTLEEFEEWRIEEGQ